MFYWTFRMRLPMSSRLAEVPGSITVVQSSWSTMAGPSRPRRPAAIRAGTPGVSRHPAFEPYRAPAGLGLRQEGAARRPPMASGTPAGVAR